jgi:hypothetical protein
MLMQLAFPAHILLSVAIDVPGTILDVRGNNQARYERCFSRQFPFQARCLPCAAIIVPVRKLMCSGKPGLFLHLVCSGFSENRFVYNESQHSSLPLSSPIRPCCSVSLLLYRSPMHSICSLSPARGFPLIDRCKPNLMLLRLLTL